MIGMGVKMKFTFINPYYEKYEGPIDDNFLPPTDLVNCASILLEKGLEVEIIDANILRLKPEEVVSRIKDSDVISVCTSPINTWQCPPIEIEPYYGLINAIKKTGKKVFLIAHGPNSSFNASGLAEMNDIVILGQPEYFFSNITNGMKINEFYNIDGIAYKKKGEFKIIPPKKLAYNMMELPLPRFDLLPHKKYRWAIFDGPMMLLETCRGCPEGCSFCFQGITNYVFSSKKVDQIINEIKSVKNLGIKNIAFIDLEISVAKEKMKQWMQELVKQGIKINWSCQIRMSSLGEEEFIKLMSDSGCKVVMVGLESATTKAFDDLPKNKDKDYVYKTVRILKKYGIKVLGYFILGSLYEDTEEEIEATIDYAKWVDVDFATFQIAIPYPTTKFHDEVKSLAKELTKEKVPVGYQKHFTMDELKRLKKKAYMQFYLRPGYVFRHLDLLMHPSYLFRNLKVFYNTVRG